MIVTALAGGAMNVKRLGASATLLLCVVLLAACGGSRGMRSVPQAAVAPRGPDEAVIVFMRPANVSGYSTSVFELRPEGDRFIAIVPEGSRFAYRTKAGRTRFMLVATGGFDDYMDAELVGGKTYAAIIRYGTVGGRTGYLLRPVRSVDSERDDVKACTTSCAWVENSERTEAWGKNHLRELPRRKASTLSWWEGLPERPSLAAADGR